jgi:hypothetical protein
MKNVLRNCPRLALFSAAPRKAPSYQIDRRVAACSNALTFS